MDVKKTTEELSTPGEFCSQSCQTIQGANIQQLFDNRNTSEKVS